ncbi:MAG: hypothetical protein HFI84_02535 [Eubacterium sp.]|nr:hypothetical protein [Eubacterium sp.]
MWSCKRSACRAILWCMEKTNRRYVVPSATGKRNAKDMKVTDTNKADTKNRKKLDGSQKM